MEHIDFNSNRHELYEDYQKLYKNKQLEVFMDRIPLEKPIDVYLSMAIPAEIARLYSDLIFRNPINAFVKENADTDNAIDRLIYENDLDNQLSESSLNCAVKGEVIAKNYLDKGKSRIKFIQPDFYFPKLSTFDQTEIESETIAYLFDDDKFIYQEIYQKNEESGYYYVTEKVSRYKNGKIGKEESSQVKNTYLTESPLTHIPLFRMSGEFFGTSLYDGLTPIFSELNHRVSEMSKILDKHSNPNLTGDPSLMEDGKNFDIGTGGKFIPVEGDEKIPSYLTWDGKMEANFKYIKEVIFEILYMISPMNRSLYGLDTQSQASGRAIKLRSWRTESFIYRSMNYWRRALKKILFQAQQLDVIAGNAKYTPIIPNVELSVALPFDELEHAQAEQLKVQSQVSSRKSSISRLNPHMTSKEIEEEWLEIVNEQAETDAMTFVNRDDHLVE